MNIISAPRKISSGSRYLGHAFLPAAMYFIKHAARIIITHSFRRRYFIIAEQQELPMIIAILLYTRFMALLAKFAADDARLTYSDVFGARN